MVWGTLKLVFLVAILVAALHFWITNKSYRFSAEYVHKVAVKHAANTGNQIAHRKIEKTIGAIVDDMRKEHGKHIINNNEWVTFVQGDVVGTMRILYMTPTEAITVQGYPISGDGHTGRSWSNMSATILTGHVNVWKEHDPVGLMAFHSGTNLRLTWGESGGIHYSDNTWLISYSRGSLITSLPYSVVDFMLSTCDPVGLYYQARATTLALFNEAALCIQDLMKS